MSLDPRCWRIRLGFYLASPPAATALGSRASWEARGKSVEENRQPHGQDGNARNSVEGGRRWGGCLMFIVRHGSRNVYYTVQW